ncbi:MAG TPA: hypothetical protein VG223_08375 [Solirubrobacteraceae bacterium]|jgi:hypothetical protein|nr:hypothetical protein [Solirubrobacteraceae bacterium]
MRARLNTYTSYSIGCAVVWALILFVARRRLDSQTRNTLQLVCGGWWTGWTSATIARISYPPPKELGPRAKKTLERVSLVLVAVGLANVIRVLITGARPEASEAP